MVPVQSQENFKVVSEKYQVRERESYHPLKGKQSKETYFINTVLNIQMNLQKKETTSKIKTDKFTKTRYHPYEAVLKYKMKLTH